MGPVVVVLPAPLTDELTQLRQTAEQIEIEHVVSEPAIEAFDKRVLVGLPWLDVVDENTVGLAPGQENPAEELGTVVDTQYVGQAPGFLELLEHSNQPGSTLNALPGV